MELIEYPGRKDWDSLIQRPYSNDLTIVPTVMDIIEQVKQNGDEALLALSKKFDAAVPGAIEIEKKDIEASAGLLTFELIQAIQLAKENIEKFHRSQLRQEEKVMIMPGIQCWRKDLPIEKVGLYIPGGTAPLFSTVLMLGVPAMIAKCSEVILCTPVNKEGNVHPAILYTASLVGITRIFAIGGAQAIAAMAFGTETIPAVQKIFGPGNQYVTTAKQLVQMQGVAIDMPAGPSELMVIADETAEPSFIASDLLSQAEHGGDSQVMLLATSAEIISKTIEEVYRQVELLPRKETALKAISNSRAILLNDIHEAIDLANAYAAEHLIIATKNAGEVAGKIINAGSVFIGNFSPESAGDYASGTNHTLPTNGFARAYSGVSVDSFVKKITFQELTEEGLNNLSGAVIEMAEAEGLKAHANAVRIRIQKS
jgi:histidinol dehydrogenase